MPMKRRETFGNLNKVKMASGNEPHFNESLLGCTKNFSSCCWGCCVPCGVQCLQGFAIEQASDGAQRCFIPCLLACSLGCIGAAINRRNLRGILKIEGGFVRDCYTHYFCGPCASCQEYREANFRTRYIK